MTGSAVAVAGSQAVEVAGVVEGPSLVEAWLASIGSRNTRAAYWSDFDQYAEHCQLAGVKALDARRVDVDSFARRLTELLGRKPSSVARAISAVSSFYEYCIDVEALDKNPVRRVKRPRTSEGHVTETPGMPWADVLRLVAAARNLGARTAIERGADLVVFLDVDCLASPGLVLAYEEASRRPLAEDAVLCGPVSYLHPPPAGGYDLHTVHALATPHAARPCPFPGDVVVDTDGHDLFWSLSFALTPQTWERVGGFDEAYAGYGAEDTDFGQRAAAAGVPLAWVGGARASHQHHPTQTPPVQHLYDVLRNGRLFRDRWGRWPMQGWLDAFEEQGLVRRTGDGDYERADAPASSVAATMEA